MPEVENGNDHESGSDHNSAADHEAMPIMCCVCRKVKIADDVWIEPEKIIPADVHVSHGFCPPCAVVEWRKIFARRARKNSSHPPTLLDGDTAAPKRPPE